VSLNPSSGLPGASVTVDYTERNIGAVSTGSRGIYTFFYLSDDNIWDTGDTQIGYDYHTINLAAGATINLTHTVYIPSGATVGNKYIIAYTDYYNSLTEADENNNTTAAAFTVSSPYPDLIVQSVSLNPSSGLPGASVTVDYTERNIGAVSTGSRGIYTFFYLSDDNIWDTGDTQIGYDYHTINLAAGATINLTHTVYIPSGATVGNKYIIAYTDYYNSLTEANENNNTNSAIFIVSIMPPENAEKKNLEDPELTSTE